MTLALRAARLFPLLRDAYGDIAMVAVVIATVAPVAVIALGSLFGSF